MIVNERAYNRNYQKRLLKYSNAFQPVIYAQIRKDFLNAAKDPENVQVDRKDYLKIFFRLYLTIGLQEASLRHNQFKQKADAEQLLYSWGNQLRNHVELELGNRITGIADTTLKDIKAIIQQGLENGDGYDKIARSLRREVGEDNLTGRINPKARALLIARTEGGNAANKGAWIAAKSSGLLMQKSWLHGYNARRKNRTAHMLLEKEKPRGIDQPFMVNGKLMQYPGDPAGGPGEVCNCKCTLLTRAVRDANGNVLALTDVEQETIPGRKLRIAVTQALLAMIWQIIFGEIFDLSS